MRTELLLMRRRKAAESLMVDTCIIDRPGEAVTDPETGVVSPSHTPVYDGRCKVQQTQAQASSPEAGGAVFTVQTSRLDLPVGAGPIETGDRIRITGAKFDPALVGSEFRVTELFKKSWPTAQRIPVEELT